MQFSYESTLQTGVAEGIANFLKRPGDVGQLGVLMAATTAFVDQVTADIMAQQPPPKPLACKAGCGYCCRGFEVHVSPLETFSIAETIAQTQEAQTIVGLVHRLLECQENKERHDPNEVPRANFECPLLQAEACQIYALRPFTCRAFNAYDAQACKRRKIEGDETAIIQGYVHFRRISDRVHLGIQQGLLEIGLDSHLLDLTPALLIALTQPDARDQWLKGGEPFKQARARLIERRV